MAKELNDAFRRQPNGLTNFLHRRPMRVEIQDVVTGTIANPMTGTNTTVRTPLAEVLQTTRKVGTSGDVGVLAAQVMYCDFGRYDVINNAQGTPRSRPRLVIPTIDFTPGISKVPMYYLPWKEDKRFTMSLGDKTDYFMTAGMHGCKFEVNHDAASGKTIVSHTNVQPTAPAQGQGNVFVQDHVRDGLERLTDEDSFANQCPTVLSFGKVSYFWDAIRESGRIHGHMLGLGVQPNEIVDSSPSGYQANVVGQRVGGQWSFYYQLTLAVTCSLSEKVKGKKWLGLKTTWNEQKREALIDVVVAVKKIWPGPVVDVPLGTD